MAQYNAAVSDIQGCVLAMHNFSKNILLLKSPERDLAAQHLTSLFQKYLILNNAMVKFDTPKRFAQFKVTPIVISSRLINNRIKLIPLFMLLNSQYLFPLLALLLLPPHLDLLKLKNKTLSNY